MLELILVSCAYTYFRLFNKAQRYDIQSGESLLPEYGCMQIALAHADFKFCLAGMVLVIGENSLSLQNEPLLNKKRKYWEEKRFVSSNNKDVSTQRL